MDPSDEETDDKPRMEEDIKEETSEGSSTISKNPSGGSQLTIKRRSDQSFKVSMDLGQSRKQKGKLRLFNGSDLNFLSIKICM